MKKLRISKEDQEVLNTLPPFPRMNMKTREPITATKRVMGSQILESYDSLVKMGVKLFKKEDIKPNKLYMFSNGLDYWVPLNRVRDLYKKTRDLKKAVELYMNEYEVYKEYQTSPREVPEAEIVEGEELNDGKGVS